MTVYLLSCTISSLTASVWLASGQGGVKINWASGPQRAAGRREAWPSGQVVKEPWTQGRHGSVTHGSSRMLQDHNVLPDCDK